MAFIEILKGNYKSITILYFEDIPSLLNLMMKK